MKIGKIILACLAGLVVMFFSGWLIWGLLLDSYQLSHTTQYAGLTKEHPDMLALVLSCFFSSLLLVIIYNSWAETKTFKKGALVGALILTIVGLTNSTYSISMLNHIGWEVAISDVLGNIISGSLVGGVIGWILGRREE